MHKFIIKDFPGGSVVKNPPASSGDAEDVDLIPGSGRPPGEENGNPLQYSCLGNLIDRGAWQATVHGGHKVSDTTELLNNNIKYQNEINYLLCSHVKGYLEDSANNHSMIKFYHNTFKKYFLLKIRRTLEGKR